MPVPANYAAATIVPPTTDLFSVSLDEPPTTERPSSNLDNFKRGLKELDYQEARDYVIDGRFAQSDRSRFTGQRVH